MAYLEFHLYRVKFIKPPQFSLFRKDISATEIFRTALDEKPSMELREDNVWHIGNIETLDNTGGKFAVGRTTKTTVEKFDEMSGDFLKQTDDSGPYTQVFFFSDIGLLGVAKKSRVAPDVKSISRRIKGLLEKTRIAIEMGVEVRVDPIPDPENFLEKIKSAYAITKFKANFTGPNPIDADELFQKPISVYCKALGGENGSVEVYGKSLNEDVVEAVTKSTAATGNTASARIKKSDQKKSIAISLKGDAVRVSVEDTATDLEAFQEIRYVYNGIRK